MPEHATIKQNSRGMTRLVVRFHIDLRADVAAYSDAMGMTEQDFIRWGMTLAVAAARQQLGPHAPAPDAPAPAPEPEPEPEPVVEEAPKKAPRKPRKPAASRKGA